MQQSCCCLGARSSLETVRKTHRGTRTAERKLVKRLCVANERLLPAQRPTPRLLRSAPTRIHAQTYQARISSISNPSVPTPTHTHRQPSSRPFIPTMVDAYPQDASLHASQHNSTNAAATTTAPNANSNNGNGSGVDAGFFERERNRLIGDISKVSRNGFLGRETVTRLQQRRWGVQQRRWRVKGREKACITHREGRGSPRETCNGQRGRGYHTRRCVD